MAEHQNLVCACDTAQSIRRPPAAVVDPGPSFMERYPEAAHVSLDRPLRFGPEVAQAAGVSLAAASRAIKGAAKHRRCGTRSHSGRRVNAALRPQPCARGLGDIASEPPGAA